MSDQRHEQDAHEAEARQRWGHTDAYRQSRKRTGSYSDADWTAIHAEMEAIESAFAESMDDGVDATDPRAMDLAERARLHIDQRYYACSHAMHSALADMYTADERFRAHYDDRREGLAAFVAAAIKANEARQEH